jgi:hypothetical protein
MGKGSRRRPSFISREREDLNWALAFGKITLEEWTKRTRILLKKEAEKKLERNTNDSPRPYSNSKKEIAR